MSQKAHDQLDFRGPWARTCFEPQREEPWKPTMRRSAMRRCLVAAAFCLSLACGASEGGAVEGSTTETADAAGAATIEPTPPSTISGGRGGD